jgi:hypothetical protein
MSRIPAQKGDEMKTRKSINTVVILAVILGGCASKNRPRDKEAAAIELLGEASPGSGVVASPFSVLTGRAPGVVLKCGETEKEVREEAERIVADWLGLDTFKHGSRITPGLPDAARRLSELGQPCGLFLVSLPTTHHPEIDQVRSILDKEDSIEPTTVSIGDKKIMSHKFGWLDFRVMENKVTAVVFDIKASGY